MCCFARDVVNVFDTLIFARLSGDGYQYLAYQMKYESKEPNAMILPLPVATPAEEKTSVEFINLREYDNFFGDLTKAFPLIPKRRLPWARLGVTSKAADGLVVHDVGNFVASFVPTVDDFDRLDEQFVIPKETWEQIPAYSDFGFAVFQLKELAGKPHPMAFRFKTRDHSLFFPTVHIHDGEVHTEEDFDHILFMQHAGFDSVVGKYRGPWEKDAYTGVVRSKDVAKNYCNIEKSNGLIAPDLMLHRIRLKGKLPNQDTILMAKGSPTVPRFNYRKLLAWWPVAIPVAAAAWLFNRRNQRRVRKQVGLDNQSAS